MIHAWRYLYVILKEQDKKNCIKMRVGGLGRQKQENRSVKVPLTYRNEYILYNIIDMLLYIKYYVKSHTTRSQTKL